MLRRERENSLLMSCTARVREKKERKKEREREIERENRARFAAARPFQLTCEWCL